MDVAEEAGVAEVLGCGLDFGLGRAGSWFQAADGQQIGLREGWRAGKGDCGKLEGLGGEPDGWNQQAKGKQSKTNRGSTH